MTDTPQGNAEVADYRLAVERHLADLPDEVRDDLVADLETHLTEVAAELEPGTTLVDRLGSPESYARELRETAAVEPEEAPRGFWSSLWAMLDPSLAWLRNRTQRYTASAGVGDAGAFRKKLKPGWWVLRGAAAAGVLFYGLFSVGAPVVITFPVLEAPIVRLALFVALALLFVWLSLRLGVKSEQWGTGRRRLVGAGSIALVWLGLVTYAELPTAYDNYYEPSVASSYDHQYEGVTDVYAFTEDGEQLDGVYLFDQNGHPLWIGDPGDCVTLRDDPFDSEADLDEEMPTPDSDPLVYDEYGYLYPLCSTREPAAEESPSPDEAEPTGEGATAEPTDEAATADPAEDETPSPEPTE